MVVDRLKVPGWPSFLRLSLHEKRASVSLGGKVTVARACPSLHSSINRKKCGRHVYVGRYTTFVYVLETVFSAPAQLYVQSINFERGVHYSAVKEWWYLSTAASEANARSQIALILLN